MKRILSLALICVLLVLSLAVPSYATEAVKEDMFFDVLAYGYPNGSSSVNIYPTNGQFSCYFEMPFSKLIRYIDILIQVQPVGSDFVAQFGNASNKTDLTVELVGSGSLYRVYGNVSYSSNRFYLFFSGTGQQAITFKSVRVSFDKLDPVYITGKCGISAYEYSSTINYNHSDTINYRRFTATDVDNANWFALFIFSDEWTKFDYLDISISLSVSSINTISCTMGSEIVPMEVSTVQSSGTWIISDYYITMRIDCRNLNRASGDDPQIIIEGMLCPNESNLVSVSNMSGLNASSSGNFLSILFRDLTNNLRGWFSSLQAALSGDESSGDAFKDDSSGLITDLDGITSEMDSVERPSMDSVNADFTADISDTSVLLGSIFSEVTSISWLSRLILASVTMGLIAYILYGKE